MNNNTEENNTPLTHVAVLRLSTPEGTNKVFANLRFEPDLLSVDGDVPAAYKVMSYLFEQVLLPALEGASDEPEGAVN